MSCNNNCGFTACGCLGVLISIVFGAVIGILFAFHYIAFITPFIWVAFGLGVLSLILLIVGLYFASVTPADSALRLCLCENVTCLLAGSIGTILSSLIALFVSLTAASIFAIIIVAITAFFFALLVLGLIVYINCIKNRLCS